jgi:Protein of unknown function (DUF2865)
MGLKLRATGCSIWRTAFLVSGLTVSAGTAVPARAYAEGFLDFLFGGFQRPSPPPAAPPPTPTVGRVAPPALGHESVSGISSIGRTVGYCVRLCDGQHFPIGQIVYGTPEDTCTAICPYSKTKLFFGSEIRSASAKGGQHYIELESAFLYRKELVANCTCNGRDPFGLAPLGVKNDPTLRPGDLVSNGERTHGLWRQICPRGCVLHPGRSDNASHQSAASTISSDYGAVSRDNARNGRPNRGAVKSNGLTCGAFPEKKSPAVL